MQHTNGVMVIQQHAKRVGADALTLPMLQPISS
jgi:hypothetical protein